MKKLLVSAGSAVCLFLISLAAYLYPLDFGQGTEAPQMTMAANLPHPTMAASAFVENSITPQPVKKHSMFCKKDEYLLMKIAMAEAEDEDTEGKALVMRVVLNRVKSRGFPDKIKEVIYQDAQFSPVSNGRFDRVEPDEDCRLALNMIQRGWDESRGALYFESKSKSTWHEDNLRFLFRHGFHYFYTSKEADDE